MRQLSGDEVAGVIRASFPQSVVAATPEAIYIKGEDWVEVATFLRDSPDLQFNFLCMLAAVDYKSHFEVVYILHSLPLNHSATVKIKTANREEASVPSVSGVWRGADFQEREAYDMMGILFLGHPNMKRILLWEGFPGHPQRKDFLGMGGAPFPWTPSWRKEKQGGSD